MQAFQNVSACLRHISCFWTCSFSCNQVLCFVCRGSSQWSVKKLGVDLTDHPWVMMMRGLLLLKPQEVRVCSCRGSSVQVSSPSKKSLKTELLTYGFSAFRTLLCCVPAAAPMSNGRKHLFIIIALHIGTHWGNGCVYSVVTNCK